MPQGPAHVLLMDSDPKRRAVQAAALRARGHQVREVEDFVGALKSLPQVNPEVLVLATEGARVDLDSLAHGVLSMPAASHLQVLAVGAAAPLSEQARGLVTVMGGATSPEDVARECERLIGRSRRRRGHH